MAWKSNFVQKGGPTRVALGSQLVWLNPIKIFVTYIENDALAPPFEALIIMEPGILSLLLRELDRMPEQLKPLVRRFCDSKLNWKPSDRTGMPSESFSAIEQICHLRDIEIDGYHERLRKTVNENEPVLHSIDGYRLAEERKYQVQDAEVVLEQFSEARHQTVAMIRGFSADDFDRRCVFEGAGEISLTSLIYFLISHDLQHLSGLHWLLAKIEAQNRPA